MIRWYDYIVALMLADLISANIFVIFVYASILNFIFGCFVIFILYSGWLGYCSLRLKKEVNDEN